MQENKYKKALGSILAIAGIEINGQNKWDIQVHNQGFYKRVLANGSLGLGESYMDGWWDCAELDQFFFRVLRANLENKIKTPAMLLHFLKAKIFNLQTKRHSHIIAEKHYDIGNDLYRHMLGETMAYTCGYWKESESLDAAQIEKFDLVCRKIDLQPGMKILDIGCGWGTFMKYAAQKYQVSGVGVTVSGEQVNLGRELCKNLPVEFRLQDYREIEGKFDRIVSLGMIEHVGYKNYRKMFEIANKHLTDDGLFLLHTIGSSTSLTAANPWLAKYIFPVGMTPSMKQLGGSMEDLFVIEDMHNFGAYYDPTLMAWYENFNRSWPEIKVNYDEKFFRMWKYYLLSCAGSFRARKAQLWQLVLSKNGVLGGYNSIR